MSRAMKPGEVLDKLAEAATQIMAMIEALRIFAKSAGLYDLEKKLAHVAASSVPGSETQGSNGLASVISAQELISSIRITTRNHREMLLRLMEQPGARLDRLMLLTEDTGNAYMNYSELIGKKLFPKSSRGEPPD